MENNTPPFDINKFIGKKIAEFRLEKGISQQQLAEKIHKESPTAISYLESGLRKVSIEDLLAIADEFGKSINDFLPNKATSQKDFSLKLRKTYKTLDNEAKKSILDFRKYVQEKFKDKEC